PALGWAGAAARAHDEAVVIFSGAVRVLDLGTLIRRRITKPGGTAGFAALPAQDANEKKKQEPWELKIGLPLVGDLRDRREHVGAGTTIRVVVGSDESDAAAYDVLIRWKKDAANTETLLHSLSVVVTPVAETHGNNSEAS
ncbi:MAG TPA: hypothetical protein VFM96_07910, partial [Gaiellaceae bacterium]|nr:hypothetical protein [Gaiellaceae bacterium]